MTEPTKKTYGRTKTGIELTDEVLTRMAQEAEAGLDVTQLRRRPGRPPMGSGPASVESVRLDPELSQSLHDRAHHEGRTNSDLIRDALRRYLQAS